ncbi:MAG: adenosylcobalamin-dependent ribonucleoside-diphosphate reductase [Patescibacteria group bacterium]|nr:adenosylcobalamin-dependent ribonucleoside-diphosphate reductase [Patescibacteria group bacterium]
MKIIVKDPVEHIAKKAEIEKINNSFSDNALKMMKKRYLQIKENGQQETVAELFHRIAHALAEVEKKYEKKQEFINKLEREFFEIMTNKEFTPAGRTITNAGAPTSVVPNCIVLGIEDSMESIFQTLKEAALLQQLGSGLGFDFSHLRPAMWPTKRTQGVASGPVSFLKIYNEAFGIIKQQGRHGANMAMMQIDHPDILDFIRAKEVEGEIRNFNISVKVTDKFMETLIKNPNEQWYCTWNNQKMKPHKVLRAPNGAVIGYEEVNITVGELFDEIVKYAWLNGEPGIVYIDEINRTNPLPGLGPIDCSNPCGEQFLHHYDNCNLGSINLAKFVKNKTIDWQRLKYVTRLATRLMDNVIDIFEFPIKQLEDMAQGNRRIGLGIMGFADMLYQLEIPYNSKEGQKLAEKVMKTITDESHKMSTILAKEKGIFPNWHLSIYKKKGIKMRNAALTTVAPTGSISMMFDTSSGIEPNFALSYIKQDKDGHQYRYFNPYFEKALKNSKLTEKQIEEIKNEVVQKGTIQHIDYLPDNIKKTFVVAMDISAEDHIRMQAAFQKNVDNSISKTINFPNNATMEDVKQGFILGWKLKCKSTTVYRDGSREVQILNIGTGENIKSPTELGKKDNLVSNKTSNQNETELNLKIDNNRLEPRKRPEVMSGKTYRVKTGYGNLYVTINNDENGIPFEVFATIGKSGGFFQEQSEGICRLISLSLRAGVKVEEIINNLKGIRGPMPMLTDKGTILSLPDAIGRILEEHVKSTNNENDKKLINEPQENVVKQNIKIEQKEVVEIKESNENNLTNKTKSIADFGYAPACPECGSPLILQEGCISCKNCGFSRCG